MGSKLRNIRVQQFIMTTRVWNGRVRDVRGFRLVLGIIRFAFSDFSFFIYIFYCSDFSFFGTVGVTDAQGFRFVVEV